MLLPLQVFKNSKRGMTEAGPTDLMDLDNQSDDEDGDRSHAALPGVKKGASHQFLPFFAK